MLSDEELNALEIKEIMEWRNLQKEREFQILNDTDPEISARDLYDRGFNIFPVERGSKSTLRKWGYLYHARLPSDIIDDIFIEQNIAVIVGKPSQNLFVVDCDDEENFKNTRNKLDESDLARWVVATSRGGHFWFLSQDGEVENHRLNKHLEVWGSNHYMISPPSLNQETGVVYSWLEREGDLPPELSKEEIHKIFPDLKVHTKLKNILPNIAHDVLINKNILDYSSNSEAENAAVWALIKYGWDNGSIIELFNEYKPPHFQERKCSDEWLLKYMINPAREDIDTIPFMNKVIKAVTWAMNQPWNSRTGNTDKSVFLACCKRAMYEGPNCFRATEREIAEIAYVVDKTVRGSLHRLISLGHLETVQNDSNGDRYERNSGTHYRINPEIQEYRIKCTVSKFNAVMSSSIKIHDIWHPKALGKSGQNVYEYLLNDVGKKIDELVDMTKKSKSVIVRALSKLEKAGLAKRENETWKAIFTDRDYLDRLAIDFNVLGIGERREEQHQRERERQAWYLFSISLTPES